MAVLLTSAAHADGKFYARESVPPGVPYQRAFIVHSNGTQTMVLQSAFAPEGKSTASGAAPASATAAAAPSSNAASKVSSDAPLGWVVPLPSVPALDTIHPSRNWELFRHLEVRTQPAITRVSEWILVGLGLVLLVLLIGSLVVVVTRGVQLSNANVGIRIPSGIAISSFAILVILLLALPALGVAGSSRGVEEVLSAQIGVYDAKVIRASNGGDLISWLNEHALHFTETDRPVLDAYIAHGWCFVVALVRPDDREAMTKRNRDLLLDPLVMRFATPEPIYPLALTATAGTDTQVLLYVLSDRRWQEDGRLPLRCARTITTADIEAMLEHFPESVVPAIAADGWLCKFKGTLTPAQMSTDLDFAPSSDTTAFRERLVRW